MTSAVCSDCRQVCASNQRRSCGLSTAKSCTTRHTYTYTPFHPFHSSRCCLRSQSLSSVHLHLCSVLLSSVNQPSTWARGGHLSDDTYFQLEWASAEAAVSHQCMGTAITACQCCVTQAKAAFGSTNPQHHSRCCQLEADTASLRAEKIRYSRHTLGVTSQVSYRTASVSPSFSFNFLSLSNSLNSCCQCPCPARHVFSSQQAQD